MDSCFATGSLCWTVLSVTLCQLVLSMDHICIHTIGSKRGCCPGSLETRTELTVASCTDPYSMGHSRLHRDLAEHWKPPGINTCGLSVLMETKHPFLHPSSVLAGQAVPENSTEIDHSKNRPQDVVSCGVLGWVLLLCGLSAISVPSTVHGNHVN